MQQTKSEEKEDNEHFLSAFHIQATLRVIYVISFYSNSATGYVLLTHFTEWRKWS